MADECGDRPAPELIRYPRGAAVGPREILVRKGDLELARGLIDTTETGTSDPQLANAARFAV